MTKQIHLVLADFLDLLAESDEPVEVGQAGPEDRYSKREAKAIGLPVRDFAASGLIQSADADRSCRKSRNRSIVRRWQAVSREACRQKAEEHRRLAARMNDDGSDGSQLTLF